ncbi:MAG: hypothetical protein J5879_04345 [Clostridia bacterium]|nr:hypothetical protein [Clostridia bacterium]
MKKTTALILALCCLLLCSCGGDVMKSVYGIFGIDNTDYSAEETTAVLDTEDETVKALAATACIVCHGDRIVPFDSFSDKAGDYIDIVLNYLVGTFYSRYSADKEMMDRFSREYPELNVNALIPLSDYESTVYSCFGGTRKATVKSTAMYSYLDKINAFVLVGHTPENSIEYTVHEAEETENTYRLVISFKKNGTDAGTYDFVFRKRESGDPYIWRLTASSKIYAV